MGYSGKFSRNSLEFARLRVVSSRFPFVPVLNLFELRLGAVSVGGLHASGKHP